MPLQTNLPNTWLTFQFPGDALIVWQPSELPGFCLPRRSLSYVVPLFSGSNFVGEGMYSPAIMSGLYIAWRAQ